MTEEVDIFGNGAAQGSLFGEGEARMQAVQRSTLPDPEQVRRRLEALLAKAKAARTMPWSERDARMWQTVFPNMANWLPASEAEQMRLDFAREIERLGAA